MLTKANCTKRLTPRELAFLIGYVEGKSATDAYLAVKPDIERESARVSACRMLKRILKKADWPGLLEASNLGELRFIRELDARLKAVQTKHYQDKEIGVFEDNATRQRATELLADLLGKRKGKIDIDLNTHNDGVRIYLPENGRDVLITDASPAQRHAWIKANATAIRKVLDECAPENEGDAQQETTKGDAAPGEKEEGGGL